MLVNPQTAQNQRKITINLFTKGTRFLYRRLIVPRSNSEDTRRREFILNIILLGTIALLSVLNLFILYNRAHLGKDYRGVSPAVFSMFVLFFILLLFLSRVGYFKISSYLLVGFYFFSVLYAEYKWGVDVPSALLSSALLIVISSVLVSTRFGFLIASLISITTIPLGYYESKHVSMNLIHWKRKPLEKFDAVEFSAILFLIMIVSWLSNREIERSLKRARESEAELTKERNLLETKVEERTMELKKLQLERMSQLYRLAEIGRLSSGLFHDLMNPLTAVYLNIERLADLSQRKEITNVQDHLNQAIRSARHLEKFIFAVRMQIDDKEVENVFSLNEVITQVMQIFEYKAKKANVHLSFYGGTDIQAFGSQLKFHQIVANLVSNAIDAYDRLNPENGPRREVHVKLSKPDHMTVLEVRDWGEGMTKDIIGRIFEPFFTTKTYDRGTGIGLCTAKNIVENYFRGQIKVESEAGRGSLFTVELVLNESDQPA